ncbi:sulfatase-like hydrolase/transferase [Aeoliella sp. ICT_H6.2]|uniref:Sulfatase-like hydrolase/transferase n=1 Tax=Aeoliella straminimaris TaxID=2954799 RepID=A0A9X2JJV0_9BACT|nr:sulfatase-like hydrolase/transferase [Aeoliella straminimaris]MCO6048072.1 sulfatase-like hydrolase/transferase [Aeoliella straminimaris]
MKFLCTLVVLLTAGTVHGQQPTERPNIIVILADDAGYHEFSMQGSTTIPTPRIDSIAASGVKFSNGYVSGCVCSPTRAGLLTGRYQQRFGHEFNIPPAYSETNGLPLSEATIADAMKSAGYRTIALGKWHLGYAPKFHPLERGFTDYYGFLQGARSYWPLAKPTRLNRLLHDREPVKPEEFDYMTDELGQKACEYIAQNRDQPFFMYLAFNATHGPLHATPADLAKTEGDKIAAMTIALDRAVGYVLDELEKQNLVDNTLVVFINDNGGATGHDNYPLRGHKGSTWEGGIRVPFAMQLPGVIPKGQVFEFPVIQLDLMATSMALAGVEQALGKPLDGVDLLPFVTGQNKGRPHQTLFWKNGDRWAVRDGDWKLVAGNRATKSTPGQMELELFDLSTDIGEQHNLAASHSVDVQRLQELYEAWKRDFPAPRWGGGARAKRANNNAKSAPAKRARKPAATK